MNTFGRLGELYDLSPATLASLAGKADMPVDPSWTSAPDIAGPTAPPDPSMAHSSPGVDPNAPSSLFSRPMGDIAPAQGAAMARDLSAKSAADATDGAPTPVVEDSGSSALGVTIPGHMQLSSMESTQEGGMRGPLAQGYADARMGEASHMNEADRATLNNNRIMSQAENMAGYQLRMQDLKAQHDRYTMQKNAEREKFVRDNQDQVAQAAADAGRKVDPDEIWHGNTFGRVMAAIAVGLGQFGATLTHTENGAAKIIDNAIRDNIDKQKTNISNAKGRIGDLRAQKMDKISSLDDDVDRHSALTIMYYDQAKQAVVDWAKKMGIDQGAPQYQQLLASMDKRTADAYKDVSVNAEGKRTEKETQKWKEAQTTGGHKLEERPDNIIVLPDGKKTAIQINDKETRTAFFKKAQAGAQFVANNNDILKYREQAKKLNPFTDRAELAKIEANIGELEVANTSLYGQHLGEGQTHSDEYERYTKKATGGMAGLSSVSRATDHVGATHEYETTNDLLNSMNERIMAGIRRDAQIAGGSVMRLGYVRDADGDLHPTAKHTGQDVAPPEQIAPNGSKPMDSRHKVATSGRAVADTTPQAPVFKGTYKSKPKGGK